jgi:hypothetical protein
VSLRLPSSPAWIPALQRLLDIAPRGHPLDRARLRHWHVSAGLIAQLLQHGWLQRLGADAFLLRGDTPTVDGTLAWLCRQHPGLHVGGRTALDWQGVRHFVALRPRLTLWGPGPARLPRWVDAGFAHTVQATALFDRHLPEDFGITALPDHHPAVRVSVPERAILELVSDRTLTTPEGMRLVLGALRTVRRPVLATLLHHCHHPDTRLALAALAAQVDAPWTDWVARAAAAHPPPDAPPVPPEAGTP